VTTCVNDCNSPPNCVRDLRPAPIAEPERVVTRALDDSMCCQHALG
jgi:hypothetical protein